MSPTMHAPAISGPDSAGVTSHSASRSATQQGGRFIVKRTFDCCLAAFGLIFLSPVLLGVAVLVRISIGRPILFRQKRAGHFSRPFMVLKFTTMSQARDRHGRLLSEAKRLTPVGRFLRASSLDELPQLWNVLQGTMSLVGPRPLLWEYVELYTQEQARRHDVLPGITGWAQVKGRNSLAWDERLELDLWYVDHSKLWLDMRILLLTLRHLWERGGVDPDGHGIVPDFSVERAAASPASQPFRESLGPKLTESEVPCND